MRLRNNFLNAVEMQVRGQMITLGISIEEFPVELNNPDELNNRTIQNSAGWREPPAL